MRKGLSVQDYVDYITLQLGSSVVTVEIEESIPKIVQLAFLELKHYITDVDTMTVPFSNKIDLKGKNIANVIYLMRNTSTNGIGGLQDIMYVYSRQSTFNTYSLTDFARTLLANQNKSALATDLDFHHDKRNEVLYVYAQQLQPTSITLVYTPDYQNVEEIIEPFWQNLLRRLALALTKETLGRVRGKYTLNSATYNLDHAQLLAEAQAELTEIRTYLNSNSDMLLPID